MRLLLSSALFLATTLASPLSSTAEPRILLPSTEAFQPEQNPLLYVAPYAQQRHPDASLHCWAINTVHYFDSPAAATTTFKGQAGWYRPVLHAVREYDGESRYRLLINGEPFDTQAVEPTEAQQQLQYLSWPPVRLSPSDRLTVEFQGHSNLTMPEGEAFAWSRGRWRALELIPLAAVPSPSPASTSPVHLAAWTPTDIPLPHLARLNRTQAALRARQTVSISSPDATGHPMRLIETSPADWSLRLLPHFMGDWSVRIEPLSGEPATETAYRVWPGRPHGTLSRHNIDPTRLANGYGTALQLTTHDLPAAALRSDIDDFKETLLPLQHSGVNALLIRGPLWSKAPSDQTDFLGQLATIEEALMLLAKRQIYAIFIEPLIATPEPDQPVPSWAFPRLAAGFSGIPSVYAPSLFNQTPDALSLLPTLESAALYRIPWSPEDNAPPPPATTPPTQLHSIGQGSYPDLAVGADGAVHLVYARDGSLYYRSFKHEKLAPEEDTGLRYAGSNQDGPQRSDPEIALAPDGAIHVLVGSSYAIKRSSRWQPIATRFQRDTALNLDSAGNAFVVKRGGNHGGHLGLDWLPRGANAFQPAPSDPDIGTAHGSDWLGSHHPYGHLTHTPDDTLFLVYRHAKPDTLSWRASSDRGQTWQGGGLYGGDLWQGEAPSVTAASDGTVLAIGPYGHLFAKTQNNPSFRYLRQVLLSDSRDLPEITQIDNDTLLVTSYGGHYAWFSAGRPSLPMQLSAPNQTPVGFLSAAPLPDSTSAVVAFEAGPHVDKEALAGTSHLYLTILSP